MSYLILPPDVPKAINFQLRLRTVALTEFDPEVAFLEKMLLISADHVTVY